MICDACKKNEATVRLVAVINGIKTEKNLCTECVDKQKHQMRTEGMQSMLSAIITGAKRSMERHPDLKCSTCGMEYDTFRKTGRVGCAQCYQEFRPQMVPVLTRLHGRARHVGRMPEKVSVMMKEQSRMEQLRREMEVAIACEDFEQAAILRDEMRQTPAPSVVEGGEAHA